MNVLENRLSKLEPGLYSKFEETKTEVNLMLQKYASNFPTYTDHSSNHTLEVFKIASELMTDEEIELLNGDEIYILSMACLLHDIGMCIPEEKIKEVAEAENILSYKKSHPGLSVEEFIRDIHHELSNKFIQQEWEILKIPTKKYALAIGLVAEGHRKVDLGNFFIYDPQFFAKSGKESVCLPYLACILRIADELDVTNSRTPKILTKYYLPNNEVSIREWKKHIATSQRNYKDNEVIFEVDCSDQNIYAALQDQFDKIQNVINYCQKIIRAIPFIKNRRYELNLSFVNPKYHFIGFHPKGIRFSFDVQNVVTAFIGEDLYKDKLTSLREAVQNAIDSCRYKVSVLKENYFPLIKISYDKEFLTIEDNGAGMDEFIIENFFGRLASSFYEQEKIKSQFEAIGQFGVGVFSYFLLSEYIDIETKSSHSEALKFRFDKDPKSYFHFYDNANRENPGTTITMHLKKAVSENIDSKMIEEYVKTMFNHVEVPIELGTSNGKTKIASKPFIINDQWEITERLRLQDRKLAGYLKIETCTIDEEDIEGIVGLIIGKEYLDTFSYTTAFFDHDQFFNASQRGAMSQISVSQKGVFVNHYSTSTIALSLGDVNLKKKIRINIDRNQFSNERDLLYLIQRFECRILTKIFSELEKKYKDREEKIITTNNFLKNYSVFRFSRVLIPEYVNFLKEYLYFKVFNGDLCTLSLNEFLTKNEEFILISDKENFEEIFNYFKLPVLIGHGGSYQGSFSEIVAIFTDILKFEYRCLVNNDKAYLVLNKNFYSTDYKFNKQKIIDITDIDYGEIVLCDSKKISLNIWKYKNLEDDLYINDEFFINYNHFFVQFILHNYDTLNLNSQYKKIIKTAFSIALEIVNDDIIDIVQIKKLNEILSPLRENFSLKKFGTKDF